MQRIAYFGPSGTFTEAALRRLEQNGGVATLLGDGPVERVAADSPSASLAMVESGAADYACVPIESSIDGPVLPTLDPLAKGRRLQIFAETELDISFSILVRPGVTPAQVRTVGAYPVAAAQVREWLAAQLPHATVVPASSNAGAAEDVAGGQVDAAVSTDIAGQRLGLESLADGVVDVAGARTRFVLVGRPGPTPKRTGSDRTGLYLYLDNNPGSLSQALLQFSIRGIDLTRIASRPTRSGLGNYYFQLDCAGHIEDTAVAEALKELHRTCRQVRYLGSWPVAHSEGSAPPQDVDSVQWLDDMKNGRDHQ
ncbi:prephenate dehydratase [Tomitella biformata]|uniref:prephenate dehydratase n=1 Tax=Tomitella biformata TaxID=630403 RepID=UPI000465C96C|nr:prephenate dehydratase [Tomitella biformata]